MLKNRTFWLFITLTILVLAFISFFLGIPAIKKINRTFGEINQKKQEITKAQEKLTALRELKTKEQNLNELSSLAQNYIPQSKREGDFIIDLEKIAQDSQVIINSTTVVESAEKKAQNKTTQEEDTTAKKTTKEQKTAATTAEQKTTAVAQTKITANLTSNFRSLLNLLFNLERGRRLSSFESLTINRDEEGILSSKIEGAIYHKAKVTTQPTLENIKISPEVENKLKNLGQFGEYINLQNEGGFGRDDPFAGF